MPFNVYNGIAFCAKNGFKALNAYYSFMELMHLMVSWNFMHKLFFFFFFWHLIHITVWHLMHKQMVWHLMYKQLD